MFTTKDRWLTVAATMGLVLGSTARAQDEPTLPRPPLQPMPKEFKVPRPKLGLPEGIPVAQESPPHRTFQTNPLPPERVYLPPPELGHEKSATLPQRPTVVGAQTANDKAVGETRVTGKVMRVDKNRITVETNGRVAMVLYVDRQTRYLRHSYDDVVPGASFAATYERRGERLFITALDLLDGVAAPVARPAAVVVQPAAAVPALPFDTEIVRIVGPDQILVRNAAGVEYPVYVTGDTRYLLGATTATFADLRPGMRIRLADELRAERHFARQILGQGR